ncbi:unnamed protein product, partial [Ascophyllum nodosum]
EAFVATEGEHAGVNTRIKDAWEASWRQGSSVLLLCGNPAQVSCC